METGIHIGNKVDKIIVDREAIDAFSSAIHDILAMPSGDKVKIEAIRATKQIALAAASTPVENTSVSNVSIHGGNDMRDSGDGE